MPGSVTREFFYGDTDFRMQIPCLQSATNSLQLTQFDKDFQAAWKNHMDQGHFRYEFYESPESRVLKGDHGFVVQLNPNRCSNRRPPQAMLHLQQPFNKDKFNFTKINEEKEGVFELKRLDSDALKSSARNLIIINVSPLEFGACLLVPKLEDCLPQILTPDSIELAINAIMLSGIKTFKAAFNSLCAYASVNHQHWHLYYLQNQTLKIETVPVKRLAGACHYIDENDYPASGFAFQVTSSNRKEVSRVAEDIHKITRYLTDNNIGHNVFITRGTSFNKQDTESYDAIRIYVWAREKIVGMRDVGAFVIAVCELSGQILCYDEKRFGLIEEDEITQAQRTTCKETMDTVKPKIKELFKN